MYYILPNTGLIFNMPDGYVEPHLYKEFGACAMKLRRQSAMRLVVELIHDIRQAPPYAQSKEKLIARDQAHTFLMRQLRLV